MSYLFGSIRQIGFVVRDLDMALQYWTQVLGVGPFFVLRHLSFENYHYRGKPSPSPCVSIACANSGNVQVELIQQHDDRQSAYQDFLEAGREGLQHVSSWLSRVEYDATMERLLAEGAIVAHEGVASGVSRFAYFATDTGDGGLMYEIADFMPEAYPIIKMVAEAAIEWDGRDPVREITSSTSTGVAGKGKA